jgi:hypothetical protein
MDPTRCLQEVLDILNEGSSLGLSAASSQEVLERLEDLGEWLKRGGFLPRQWKPKEK